MCAYIWKWITVEFAWVNALFLSIKLYRIEYVWTVFKFILEWKIVHILVHVKMHVQEYTCIQDMSILFDLLYYIYSSNTADSSRLDLHQ